MNTRRNFVNYATMTLHDGTVLNLTPSDFRISGNSFTDDLVDGDSFQIGSAIGKTATLLLDNTDGRTEIVGSSTVTYPHGKFSEYDFYMAYFTLYVCLPDSYHYEGELRDQMIRIGRFTVVNPVANSSTIEITGVDNMYMFDKSFDECNLDFTNGVSLLTVLNKCCQDCNVVIGYGSFDNQNLTVNKKPEGVTYRQVVSYIAQIAGCNAKITETGALTLVSYDMSPISANIDGGIFDSDNPYSTGDDIDGGYFDMSSAIVAGELTYVTPPESSSAPLLGLFVSNDTTGLIGTYDSYVYIDNISDEDNFNCQIIVYKYENSAYTVIETIGHIPVGYTRLSDLFVLQDDGNTTWYYIRFQQRNTREISFDVKVVLEEHYDGGDFTTPLRFHNLTATTGTQISTDDVQFTGVEVKVDETDVHYPDTDGWDNYVLLVSDNPFVEGYESNIAIFLYNKLSTLKFRPFSCQSIQDPTIEAGDCAIVYDTKGNMYNSIITNVQFTTGGYTELSCKAQSPIKQNSRYVNPAAQAVVQAEKKMDDYNAQVAHFNELASEALGYYQTVENNTSTGATITYIHNNPTLETSTIIWKITADGIFISEDGGQSYNAGYDTSTGTMLVNLVYARGLSCDWIRTGELDVGVGNEYNTGSVFRAFTDYVMNSIHVTAGSTITFRMDTLAARGFNSDAPLGVYVSNISTGDFTAYMTLSKYVDGSPVEIERLNLVPGNNLTATKLDHTLTTNPSYMIRFNANGGANEFDVDVYVPILNTSINNTGINTQKIIATGGEIAGYTINDPVNGNGLFYNKNDVYAEYSVNKMHIGGKDGNTWTFTATAEGGGFLHIDYASYSAGGLWITGNGANDIYDFSGGAMHITKSSVSCDAHGEVQWSGSDRKLKKNIKDLSIKKAQQLISMVRPREFEFKSKSGTRYGFIAQELREVLSENSGIEFENAGIRNINYNDFIAPLCMIVNKQQKEIDLLKAEVEQLKSIVNAKE